MTAASSPGYRASFLDSTTSSEYELDLPPLPTGPLQEATSAGRKHPRKLDLKPKSPIYSNVNAVLGLQTKESSSPNLPLTTILEVIDRDESSEEENGDGLAPSDYREQVYSKVTSQPEGQELGRGGFLKSQQYTKLQMTTIDDNNVYENPVNDHSSQHHPDVSGDHSILRASSPEFTGHQTSYFMVDDNGESEGGTQQKRNVTPWNLRGTLHRKYMQMKMVGMRKSICGSEHSGAKKFFTYTIGVIFLLLVAAAGVVLATVTWNFFRKETALIEEDLSSYTTSLRTCRVGRNWTSMTIDASSTTLKHQLSANSDTMDVLLNETLLNEASLNITSLNAKQILLYIIIRTNTTSRLLENGSGDFDLNPSSFINVALWTRSRSRPRPFRQYMCILNDIMSPQIVSSSVWFPLQNTNNHLYANAMLMDGLPEQNMYPIDLTIYLAGYC